jgi:hypothetical protein
VMFTGVSSPGVPSARADSGLRGYKAVTSHDLSLHLEPSCGYPQAYCNPYCTSRLGTRRGFEGTRVVVSWNRPYPTGESWTPASSA